jgi:hypothetical protein
MLCLQRNAFGVYIVLFRLDAVRLDAALGP